MQRNAFAPGKIILSGEYAVVFGYPGIAVPAERGMTATFEERQDQPGIEWKWLEEINDDWKQYINNIIQEILSQNPQLQGTVTIENQLPLGKGMGSSTALIITLCRCLLGEDCKEVALAIEDKLNPGHSGVDFNVIWEGKPIKFVKDEGIEVITLPDDILANTELYDTGSPDQQTPELVAWVKERKNELSDHLEIIGRCTERLLNHEDIVTVVRDHHRAQVGLGVVPEEIQQFIADVESQGGAAKVIGAGAKTGGAGMVLSFSNNL